MTLRRATSIRVDPHQNWFGRISRVEIQLGAKEEPLVLDGRSWARVTKSEQPVAVITRAERTLWHTTEGWFWEDDGLAAEDVSLLLWDRNRRLHSRLDRLRKIQAREGVLADARRARIPEEVRRFVWERDLGRCVRCETEDDLQFDHVIPFSRGGGNSEENIQILCGRCNREKSNRIA